MHLRLPLPPHLRLRLRLHLLYRYQRPRQLGPEGLSHQEHPRQLGPEGLSRQEGRLPRQEGPRQEGLPHSDQPDPGVNSRNLRPRRPRAHRMPPELLLAALALELDRLCVMDRSPCIPR